LHTEYPIPGPKEPPIGNLHFILTRLRQYIGTIISTAVLVFFALYLLIPGIHPSFSENQAELETAQSQLESQQQGGERANDAKQTFESRKEAIARAGRNLREFRKQHAAELEGRETILYRVQQIKSKNTQSLLDQSLLETRHEKLQLLLAETPKLLPPPPTPAEQRVITLTNSLIDLRLQYPGGHPDITAIERLIAKAQRTASTGAQPAQTLGITNAAYTQLEEQISLLDGPLRRLQEQIERDQKSILELNGILERQPAIYRELALLKEANKRELEPVKTKMDNDWQENTSPKGVSQTQGNHLKNILRNANRFYLFLGVLAISLATGIGVAYLRIHRSGPISTLDHLKEMFVLPVLGSVSYIPGLEPAKSTAPSLPDDHERRNTFTLDIGNLQKQGFITGSGDLSPLALEVRTIKHQLLDRILEPSPNATSDSRHDPHLGQGQEHVIMVTSTEAGDGKSFLATNLALSLIFEEDLNVLLIDADMTRPSLNAALGVHDGAGLTDLLADIPSVLTEILRHERELPLTFLPAGHEPTSATDVHSNPIFTNLIGNIARRYRDRVIIIDAPPLLAASGPSVLASQIGQTVLVLNAEQSSRSSIDKTLNRLESHDNVTLVLNKVRPG